MDVTLHTLSGEMDQLLGRASGPLHFRLLVMPIVVTVLGTLAGLKDARAGQSKFLWGIVTNAAERPRLIWSVLKDVGKVFVVALALDTTYQLMVLPEFHVGQVLFVAIACAVVPYFVVRGPVSVIARLFYAKGGASSNELDVQAASHARRTK